MKLIHYSLNALTKLELRPYSTTTTLELDSNKVEIFVCVYIFQLQVICIYYTYAKLQVLNLSFVKIKSS